MAIEKMILMNMTFDKSELQKVLFHLRDSKELYLQPANKVIRKVKDVSELDVNPCYERLFNQLTEISQDMDLKLTDEMPFEKTINLSNIEEFLNLTQGKISEINKIKEELIKEKDENEKTLQMLYHLNDRELNLDELLSCQYITVRFGRLRKNKFNSLKYYNKPFIFNKLGEDKEYIWCCYVVTNSLVLEVDNIFQGLAFENISMPDFVHGTIEGARQELETETKAMHEYILRMDSKMATLREANKVDLLKMYATLKYFLEVEKYKTNIVDFSNKYAFYAFVSKRVINEVKEKFQDVSGSEYYELPSDILKDQGIEAPQIIYNPFWARPFELMSKVQPNDNVDTTMATAILFYIVTLFLLGDIGVAIVVGLVGLLMKKKPQGHLLIALSIPLMIGGLLMGSVFYTPLYKAFFISIPALYRIIDGIVLLFAGNYTIQSIKEMCSKKPLVTKLLSFKGVCGIVALNTLLIYLLCVYEIHISISLIPVTVVLFVCVLLVFIRTILDRKIE